MVPATAASSSNGGSVPLGMAVLDMFQVKHDSSWVWDGVGVLVGMAALCAAVSLVAFTYNKLAESPAVQPSKQQQQWQQQRQQQCRKQQEAQEQQPGCKDEVVIQLPGM